MVRLASEFISRSTRASSVAASRPGLRLISRGTGDAAASAPILALTGKTAGPEMPNGVAWTSPNDSIAGWPSGRATSLTLRSLRPARRLKNGSRQTSGTSAGRGATIVVPERRRDPVAVAARAGLRVGGPADGQHHAVGALREAGSGHEKPAVGLAGHARHAPPR